jgi:aryl-alcohol dehydrogenase-like predicted oxidoreductase
MCYRILGCTGPPVSAVGLGAWQYGGEWCLKNPTLSSVIPGCVEPTQVAANAAAADLEIE